MHGGSAPQVIRAAKERIQRLTGTAAEKLGQLLEDRPPCDTCGYQPVDAVTLAAVKMVLDYSGIEKVNDGEGRDDRWLEFSTAEEGEQIVAIMNRCLERMADEGIEVPGLLPENVSRGESYKPPPYVNYADTFDADHLPTPRTTRDGSGVNEAHSTPPEPEANAAEQTSTSEVDDDWEEF